MTKVHSYWVIIITTVVVKRVVIRSLSLFWCPIIIVFKFRVVVFSIHVDGKFNDFSKNIIIYFLVIVLTSISSRSLIIPELLEIVQKIPQCSDFFGYIFIYLAVFPFFLSFHVIGTKKKLMSFT